MTKFSWQRKRALLLSATTLFLQSCIDVELLHLDWADKALSLTTPVIEPLRVLPDTRPLSATMQQSLDLRRAFFAGDYSQLDHTLLKLHDDYVAGSGSNVVIQQFLAGLRDTQLTGMDACQQWLKTMPQSYTAHWICGAMWYGGAWVVRGGDVSSDRHAIMNERLDHSITLLEKAQQLHPKPLYALTILAESYYLYGNRSAADNSLLHAQQLAPRHAAIYQIRMNYLLPEHGGNAAQLQQAFEQAQQAQLAEGELLDLQDKFIVRPHKLSDPAVALTYWERAIRGQSTQARLSGWLDDLIRAENWTQGLAAADRLIASYPDDDSAYFRRAKIREKLGQHLPAYSDYWVAAAMGHNHALQALVLAQINGGLGITRMSFNTVAQLCRYGATLGSSVGSNCVGSLYFEGGTAEIPFTKDLSQSLAWHLRGARGGHFNSQHDLGWLLYSGKAGTPDADLAREAGVFWLRRAAEMGHPLAKQKLQQNDVDLTELPDPYSFSLPPVSELILIWHNLIKRLLM